MFDPVYSECIQPGASSVINLTLRNIGQRAAENTTLSYSCGTLLCDMPLGPFSIPAISHIINPLTVNVAGNESLGAKLISANALDIENNLALAAASITFSVDVCQPITYGGCALVLGTVDPYGLCPPGSSLTQNTTLSNAGNQTCENVSMTAACAPYLNCTISPSFISSLADGSTTQIALTVSSPRNDTLGVKNITMNAASSQNVSTLLRAFANVSINCGGNVTNLSIWVDNVRIKPDNPNTSSTLNCSARFRSNTTNLTGDVRFEYWRRPRGEFNFTREIYNIPSVTNVSNNTTVFAPVNATPPLNEGDWWKCSAQACEKGRTTNCSAWVNSTPVYVSFAHEPERFIEVFLISPPDNYLTNSTTVSFSWMPVSNYSNDIYCQLSTDALMQSPVYVRNSTVKNQSVMGFSYAEHTWKVNCTDSTGAPGESERRTFIVCNGVPGSNPPSVVLNSPARGAVLNATVTLNWTATDDRTQQLSCSIFLDGNVYDIVSAQSGIPKTYALTGLAEGAHAWGVHCMDENCNIGKGGERVFYVCTQAGNCVC